MPKRLPPYNFNKFIYSAIIDIYEMSDIKKVVSFIVEHTLKSLPPERGRLAVVSLYSNDMYECRLWVLPPVVYTVCNLDEKYKPEELYRVMVEIFDVTRILAAHNIDNHRHMGFEVQSYNLNEKTLEEIIVSLLGLTEEHSEKRAVETVLATSTGASVPASLTERPAEVSTHGLPVKVEALSREDLFNMCLLLISAHTDAVVEPGGADVESALEEHGVVATGRGGSMLCLMRLDDPGCPYIVLDVAGGSMSVECLTRKDDAVEVFRRKMRLYTSPG